jgi:hypothetical protein
MRKGILILLVSLLLVSIAWAAPEKTREPGHTPIPQERLDAQANGLTFQVRGDRAQDITIELTVDTWYGEASWNLYSYVEGAYYYAENQEFTTGGETVTEILSLDEGDYSVDCFDTYGDGGIAGTVYDAEDNVLVSWADDAYYDFGEFPFTVAPPPFEFVENFDAGIPAEWEVTGDPSWVGMTEYGYGASTLDGTPFAMIDSDDAGSGTHVVGDLISPAMDVTGYDSMMLEFEQYYNNISADEVVNVQVWDGTAWQVVAEFTEDMGAWGAPDNQVIDVTAYANTDFKVKFHYDDGDAWAWYWAVDNVKVYNPIAGTLEGYVYAYGTTNPIEGATVTCGEVSATTDATGFYTLEPNAGSYEAVADAENYFPATEAVEIVTNEVTTQDFELTWAEIAVDPAEVNVEVPGGLTEEATLTISNPGGTAPLTYNAGFFGISKRTITLKETKERGENYSGFSKTEQITVPDNRGTGWYSYSPIDDMTSLTWAAPERATFFQMADFGIPYPVEITNLSHWFYEHSSYPWDNDQFKFKIYAADGTTLLYESDNLTAEHLVEYNYTLEEPLVVEDDFWVAIAPISASGFPSSTGTNLYDGHSYVWNPGTNEWELYAGLEYTTAVGLSQWLTISNATGTIEPGASAEITLNLDAAGLENVTKTGEVFIQNDALYPMDKGEDFIVPVTMEVGAAVPIFEFDYTTTDFGSIPIGATEGPETYGIQNVGSGTFVVEELTITGDNQDEFILDDSHEYPLEIAPGERINVDVSFAPNSIGDKQAYLFVVNDIGREVEVLEFTGNAYVPDLPGAPSNPTPQNGLGDVSVETGLSWENGPETVSIDLYFDTVNPPQNKVLDDVTAVENYDPGTLDFETTYYWKVVARNITGETQGATWFFMTSDPGTGPMTFLEENFDTGIPAEWEITGDVAPWHGATDYSGNTLDGTPFAFVDSDAAGSGGVHVNSDLITPPLDTTAGLTVKLEFDQYYNYISTSEVVNVQVWDGSEWQIILDLTEDMGDWGAPDHQEIDISDYSNQELKVKFHYDDGTSWAWYWAVDNVKVNSGAQIPVFTITPAEHDFGSIPVYTWETQEFVITNTGVNDLIVQDLSVTGPDAEHFELTDNNEYPVTISPEDAGITVEVKYAPMTAGEHSAFLGVYTGEDAENQHVIDIAGSAYMLPDGDIAGNPFLVEFTDGFYTDNSTNDGFEDNYDLPSSDGADIVYQFTLEEDTYMDSISLYGSDFDTKMAVYADGVVPGPDNYLYYNDDRAIQSALYDIPLFAGTYNVVVDGYGGAVGNVVFSIDIGDPLPAPVAATNPSPENGAVEVPADGTILTWEIGEFTKYVDVYFGTTYPPELVLENGDRITEYDPGTLEPNQIYFWKIVSKNTSGSAESELWGFTSTLTPPTGLAAEVIDYVDVELTWEGPTGGGGGGGGGGGSGDEFTEDFEAGLPSDWTIIDADGDSYNWEWSNAFTAHSGVGVMYSASYLNNVGVLTPDNYLITPQVEIGDNSEFSFWYVAQDPNWPGDRAYIKVSTTDTNPASFTEELGYVEAGPTYTQATFDMSDFSGETVYIALEHTDCSDFFYINVDDVALTNASKVNNTDVAYNTQVSNVDPLKDVRLSEAEFEAKLEAYTASRDRAFIGYNVYRDGEIIAENVAETSYYDEAVAVGTHTYEVSAVYHEGESAPSEPVEALIPGIGMIYGTVTDEHSGATINAAEITAVNVDDEEIVYTATSNLQGNYEIPEVLEGTYTITCEKDGYPDEVETDIYVGHEDEVEVNFTPNNFGLPPTLTAESGVDEAVPLHVSPWGGTEEYTQAFHDGGFESQLGCGGGCALGVRFTPAGYPAELTHIQVTFQGDANCTAGIFSVYLDPEGAVAGPPSAPTAPGDPSAVWESAPGSYPPGVYDLDITDVTIESGDVYVMFWENSSGFAGVANDLQQNHIDRNWGYISSTWTTIYAAVGGDPTLTGNFGMTATFVGAPGQAVVYEQSTGNGDNSYSQGLNLAVQEGKDISDRIRPTIAGNVGIVPANFGDRIDVNIVTEEADYREVTGYEIWRSLDGEDFGTAPYHVIEGSGPQDWTDEDVVNDTQYWYYANVIEDGTTPGDPSEIVTATPHDGVAPGPIEDFNYVVDVPNKTVDFSWVDPSLNEDGTLCEDLVGIEIYRDGNLLITIDPWVGSFQDVVPENADYTYEFYAIDEVPNMSEPVVRTIYVDYILFMEDWSNPMDWTLAGAYQNNWIIPSETNSAGGEAPEAEFDWLPDYGSVDTAYLVSPTFSTAGMTNMTGQFRQYLDWYSNTVTLGVATSSDGGSTWNDAWSQIYSADSGPETINFEIDTPDVGSNNFQMCWYIESDPWDIMSWYIDDLRVSYEGGGDSNDNNDIPLVTKLSGNYPNPFNPETTINFSTKEDGNVRIDIYNIKGQKVKTLVNEHMKADNHKVVWTGEDSNGRQVSSGVYFYKMKAGKYTSTKKMILMK